VLTSIVMDAELNRIADEIRRDFDLGSEALRSDIQILAKGIQNLDEKVERKFGEVRRELEDSKSMI
jgi:hypothetical protein